MAGPGPMLDAGLDESASAPLDPDAEQPEAHAAFLMGVSTIHAIRGLGTDPSCGGPMYAQSACSLEALSRAVGAPTLQTHPPSVDTLCAHDGRRDILGSRCAVGRRDGATSAPTSKTRRLCGDDVDDTSNCIAAVQGRGWPCNQFDSFDFAHRDRKRFPCVRLSESASETRRPLSRTRMRLFPTLVSPRIPMTPCASFADTTSTPGVPRRASHRWNVAKAFNWSVVTMWMVAGASSAT